jgi:hypothetical protein
MLPIPMLKLDCKSGIIDGKGISQAEIDLSIYAIFFPDIFFPMISRSGWI